MVNHFRTSNRGNIASLTPEGTEEGEFVVGPRWNSPTFKTMAGQGESGVESKSWYFSLQLIPLLVEEPQEKYEDQGP